MIACGSVFGLALIVVLSVCLGALLGIGVGWRS